MPETKPVLLTVSGTIPPDLQGQIERGERPETDYVAMARAFQANLIDYAAAREVSGRFGRVLEALAGPQLMLAWACFLLRKQYQLIFTDGEQIGIPLALLFKYLNGRNRPRHFMIVHILSVKKKTLLLDLSKAHTHIDRFFTYSTFQQRYIQNRWGLPADRVLFTPFMVDHHFFSPEQASPGDPLHLQGDERPLICSVGLEYRDYPTLIEAVRGLNVRVVIAAASPWSKQNDTTRGQEIPGNVTVRRFSQHELRDVYAASRLVVMPLYPVEFQAGVTTILEAMAMAKPVVCSRTPGQTDVILDGRNGVYVPPGNPAALREAIRNLLDRPDQARELGLTGRRLIAEAMNLEQYARSLNAYIQESLDQDTAVFQAVAGER